MGKRAKPTEPVIATEGEIPAEATVTETRTETRRVKKLTATAKVSAFLPDGTFVGAGEKVEITPEYAERLRAEGDNRFVING